MFSLCNDFNDLFKPWLFLRFKEFDKLLALQPTCFDSFFIGSVFYETMAVVRDGFI